MEARQQLLGFAEAEASHDERRAVLGLALLRTGCDCELSVFVQWVFNATKGGLAGELVRSHSELAAAPWGLCCSREKAKSTVSQARRWHLVAAIENRYTSEGQRANGYRIDWAGVRRLLQLGKLPRAESSLAYEGSDPPPGLTDPPPGLTDPPPGLTDPPYIKENSLLASSLKLPDPDPGAGAGPGDFQERATGGSFPTAAAAGSVAVAEPRAIPDLPELVEARRMPVSPLPAGDLLYGLWHGIAREHLATRKKLVGWFRRQLSLAQPVCDAHQADLLLVLAAARRADQIREIDVTNSRVALFVGIVFGRRWQRVLRHVPEAREWLDRLLELYPEALSCPDWPPKPKEP